MPTRANRPRLDATALALALVCTFGALSGVWRTGGQPPAEAEGAGDALAGVLGGGPAASGFAKVTGPRPFRFPADHGAHPDYRSEWWYLTGNLKTPEGRAFGVQLTFFRFALTPSAPDFASAWATRQAWMAHFAVTDIQASLHHGFERFERGALGLAGVQVDGGVRVWLDDWRLQASGNGLFPLDVRAGQDGVTLELTARRAKPRVLQGEAGYSHKGGAPDNASYYYSYPRLAASGHVRIDGERYPVSGLLWLDREWSTSALAANQVGWDWFALHLDDGRDLMLYRLRRRNGSTDPASAGVLVTAEGSTERLDADEFSLSEQRWWTEPETKRRYPVAWRLRVPGLDLDLGVEARVDDQVMGSSVRYWEGSVAVRGRAAGLGYMELTGY